MVAQSIFGIVALAALAGVVGCGGDDEGGGGGSVACQTGTTGAMGCIEYSGTGSTQSIEDACTQGGGTVVSSCPSDGVGGSCKITGGEGSSGSITTYYYDMDAQALEAVQGACTQTGGTWSA